MTAKGLPTLARRDVAFHFRGGAVAAAAPGHPYPAPIAVRSADMSRARRLAFLAGICALTAASAAVTVGVARVVAEGSASAAPQAAVAAVQKTLVVQPAAAAAPRANTTARSAVLGFLNALQAGDYARACDQLLQRAGCEDGLAASNAGVTDFRLVAADVDGASATVDAVADGVDARFVLERRGARWWIAELVLDP